VVSPVDGRGRTFSNPVHVSGDGDRPARGPSLAVHGDTVYLTWTLGHTDDANVHWTRFTEGGRETGPVRVAHDRPGHADAPKLATSRDGTLHLVYGESHSGMFGEYHVRYARTGEKEERFSPTRRISGNSWFSDGAHFPSMAVSDSNVFVTWHRFSTFQSRPNGLSMVHSTNGGRTFSDPFPVPNSSVENGFNGSQQGLLREKLAVHNGTIAVVNSDYAPGEKSTIWLWKATSSP
jgi:hypothetical protein